MLQALFNALKWIYAPGSWAFLSLCGVIALLLAFAWPRRRRLTVAWTAAVLTGYLVLALPCVSEAISQSLPPVTASRLLPSQTIASAQTRVLVVFDGDNRYGRVREAARLYRALSPAMVWSLGRERWMEKALRGAGMPHVTHVASTTTTREQIMWIERLEATSPDAVIIVASRLQAPRVDALLCTAGARARLAAAPVDADPASIGFRRFVPSYFALRISRDALYEHMALFYYRQKGWIA